MVFKKQNASSSLPLPVGHQQSSSARRCRWSSASHTRETNRRQRPKSRGENLNFWRKIFFCGKKIKKPKIKQSTHQFLIRSRIHAGLTNLSFLNVSRNATSKLNDQYDSDDDAKLNGKARKFGQIGGKNLFEQISGRNHGDDEKISEKWQFITVRVILFKIVAQNAILSISYPHQHIIVVTESAAAAEKCDDEDEDSHHNQEYGGGNGDRLLAKHMRVLLVIWLRHAADNDQDQSASLRQKKKTLT